MIVDQLQYLLMTSPSLLDAPTKATYTQASTNIQAAKTQRQTFMSLGATTAAAAGAGLATSGSALDLLRFSASQGALSKALVETQGQINVAGYEFFEESYPDRIMRNCAVEFSKLRRMIPSVAQRQRNFPQPLWLRAEPIAGKTILLHSEQGFGDAIQFCRYAPLVAARGARVILEVDAPLRELMSGLAGVSQCIAKGEPLPDFDLHCPLCSLPLAFGTRLDTIPAATSYLRPPESGQDWEARLGPRDRLRIGLVWSGNPRLPGDRYRSIAFNALSSLFDVKATFVALQKDVRVSDQAPVLKARGQIRIVGPSLASFADTASLISCLDLVISVDTGVAHLARRARQAGLDPAAVRA